MLTAIAEQDDQLIMDLIDRAGESASTEMDALLARVSHARAMSEGEKNALAQLLLNRATGSMDTEWAFGGVLFELLDPDRQANLQADIYRNLESILENLASVVYSRWATNENPEDSFNQVLDNLNDLSNADDLPPGTDALIQAAASEVEAHLSTAQEEYSPEPDEDDWRFDDRDPPVGDVDAGGERDVFDDVDAD